MTEKEHSEDIQDLGTELERVQTAYRIACQNIATLSEQREELKNALAACLNVIDQLLTALRLADITPAQGLIQAKGKLDVAMKRLLKDD